MLPHFIIIGAMKAGTTSLYSHLKSHPETVHPSNKKEPIFFRTEEDFSKGVGWYESLFQGPGKYAFEASTHYTLRHRYPEVAARIRSVIPGVKLIYLLRDPIDRIRSQYVVQYASRLQTGSIHEAIREDPEFVQISSYYHNLEPFREHFPDSQIHIATLEDLKRDPKQTLQTICSFLEIPYLIDDSILEQTFNSSARVGRTTRLEIALRDAAPHRYLASAVVRAMRPFRPAFERPSFSEQDVAYLMDKLRPDVEKLREYTGRPFSDWRPY